MAVLINEQIKAFEVMLTGLNGEKIGVVSREEALALAKAAGADLVCTSLMSSPPPCSLTPKGKGKDKARQDAKTAGKGAPSHGGKSGKSGEKVKELRFTAHIEEHDYDTKLRQADKLLRGGSAVQIVVKASGAKEGAAAKAVLERLLDDLKEAGRKESGIQTSGKGSQVKVNPL
ncbi:translation initiation factor IF-3 [Paenibacillus humicus]|uniref:translation initiation factor IF-3 n=1 Tax=Paenibacillus humicus TaxID=412861 RepID=UPI000FD829C1|nr:translation initiation factor IF-3 [Paenibacillus humicus]